MKNFLTLILSTLFAIALSGQTSLQGKVTAADTGEELISANILLKRNGVFVAGVSTDFNGNYSVNLDPGTYDVEVSYLGYPNQMIQGVVVKPGQANKLDIEMADAGVVIDEIVIVEYKVPLIKRDNTTQGQTITAAEIRNLPTRNVYSLAATTIGISQVDDGSNVTVRGSRANATDYYIDGVRVRGIGHMIPSSKIQEYEYIIGGLPAKYEATSEEPIHEVIIQKGISPKREKVKAAEAGILTAGEWNGLNDWGFWENLLNTQDKPHQQTWQVFPSQRFSVEVVNPAGIALPDCTVKLLDQSGAVVWQTKTDNKGKAELWANLHGGDFSDLKMIAENEGISSKVIKALPHQKINKLQLSVPCKLLNNLDIAFVVDATGSMSDEINYLTAELRDVIKQVQNNNEDLIIRTGSVFYRDQGDEYLTRNMPLSENLNKTVAFIGGQHAGGGGDFPEAVDAALEEALNLDWSENAIARILFLILDAPPHAQPEVLKKLQTQIQKAAELGIRIIPIVASGIDQSTEFLMKTLAITTNGTYVFITDHSGIGNPHLEATVSAYKVEMLNDLMVRLIDAFSEQADCKVSKQDRKMAVAEGVDHSSPESKYLNQMIYFYPNPADDLIFIELKEKFDRIRLVSVTGRKVKTIDYPEAGVSQMDVSDLPAGAYFLQFQKGNEVITKRLIVARP